MLPDMGQTEKERGESHEWALMFMLPVYYRERKIRSNMLTTNPMQGQVRCSHI